MTITHFFDVQEVFGVKVDRSSLDGTVLIQSAAVTHVGLYCKRYGFGLRKRREKPKLIWT